jgi:glycerol kinase
VTRILAIDAGTTGVRAIVFGPNGSRLGSAYREIEMRYPRPGWVEQDLSEIWEKTWDVVAGALRAASLSPHDLAAIGITNQRSSIAAWDERDMAPLSPMVSWQDVRAAERAAELHAAGFFVTPNVAVSKAEWIVRNIDGASVAARTGRLRLGGMEAWLVAKLSGGAHVCDHANASATGFYAHLEECWDARLLDAVGVAPQWLPQLVDCAGVVATTAEAVFGARVPIAGLCGDQQAALFGLGCQAAGATKCSYGTSAMLDASSGASLALGGPGTYPLIAWRAAGDPGPTWCVEGAVITAGAAVQWVRDSLGLIRDAAEISALASRVSDSGGVWVVPSLQGLGTPFNEPRARGMIGGLSRSSGAPHIARAVLDGIANRVCDVAHALWAGTGIPASLRADGGASRNDVLMQTQSDLLGLPIERGTEPDGSALGVAQLAARGAGLHDGIWGGAKWIPARVFEPSIGGADRAERRSRWQQVVGLAARAETEDA